MGQSLKEIAQTLRGTNKKVQLIYAFNGVGKTRLYVNSKSWFLQRAMMTRLRNQK